MYNTVWAAREGQEGGGVSQELSRTLILAAWMRGLLRIPFGRSAVPFFASLDGCGPPCSASRWQSDPAEDLELDWSTSNLEYCDRPA
jgi:hypothetical protein